MLTIGVELPFGAYGIGIERGSVMVVQGTDTDATFRPFFEFLAYESYLGLPPEILDTIKGTFAFGEHPRFPWLVGIEVPCWFLVLGVVAVGVATTVLRQQRLGAGATGDDGTMKTKDSPEE